MRRLLSFILILALLLSCVPTQIYASKDASPTIATAKASQSPYYGLIQAKAGNMTEAEPFRAAKDPEGDVYIQLSDFTRLIGGTIEKVPDREHYLIHFGNWCLIIYCREMAARLLYRPAGGAVTYDYFDGNVVDLSKALFNREDNSWYFLMEELLYLSLSQWFCDNNTVIVYQPETLLDIIPDLKNLSGAAPTQLELLLDDIRKQVGNSKDYAMLAIIDEIDAGFIASGFLNSIGLQEFFPYEIDAVKECLMLLADDSPYNNAEKEASTAQNGLESFTEFIKNTSRFCDIVQTEQQTAVLEKTLKMLGTPMTAEQCKTAKSYLGAAGNLIQAGAISLDFYAKVADAMKTREELPEIFYNRLVYLQRITELCLDDEYSRKLNEAVQSAYNEYYGDFASVLKENFDLQYLMDVALSVGPLNWIKWTLAIRDFSIEDAKTNPIIKQRYDNADAIYRVNELLSLSDYMIRPIDSNLKKLGESTRLDQAFLNDLRISCQIRENAGIHALKKLQQTGKYVSRSLGLGIELLQRLSVSSRYDKLLLITHDFANIHSQETGSTREVIPPEYVYRGDGIFLVPVIQHDQAPNGLIPIETQEDMLNIKNDMSAHYILMADLEFKDWMPLGDSDNPFTGSFDGNGHSITIQCNRQISFNEDAYGGVFYQLKGPAVVKNLIVKGDLIYKLQEQKPDKKEMYGDMSIGGVCAYISGNALIYNCVNFTNISKTSKDSSFWYSPDNDAVGGIAGCSFYGSNAHTRISYCRNFGQLTSGSDVGGIIAIANFATIFACQNEGVVYSSVSAGGIASTSQHYIQSCANLGDVTGLADSAGGIVNNGMHIENCVNTGTVYAKGSPVPCIGGIAGTISGTIKNSLHIGKVQSGQSAICCQVRKGAAITNSYWIANKGTLYDDSFSEGTILSIPLDTGKLKKEELSQKECFVGFDFMGDWTLREGMQYPYPSLLLLNGQRPNGIIME